MMAFRMHHDDDSDLDTSDDDEMGMNTRAATLRAYFVNQNRRTDLPYSANPEEQIIERRGRRQIPRTPVRKSPRKRPSSVLVASELLDAASGPPPSHRLRTQEPEVPLVPIFMQEKEKEIAPKFNSELVEAVGERTVEEAAPKRLKIPPPAPQQSPFTKCLRGLMLSPPRPTNRTMSSLRKRLLLSPNDSTEDYFSSSMNSSTNSAASTSTRQSTSSVSHKKYHYYSPISHNLRSSDTPPAELFDDSGVDMSSPIMSSSMVAITPEDLKLQQLHTSHEFDNMSVKSMSSAASSINSKSSKSSINRARRRFRF